jgi:hypothetical protein
MCVLFDSFFLVVVFLFGGGRNSIDKCDVVGGKMEGMVEDAQAFASRKILVDLVGPQTSLTHTYGPHSSVVAPPICNSPPTHMHTHV